ncbi:CLUMA_CG019486, isoform A [Clunio marinus]|uniref:CLUMA_CG019486, isoform A n=1 Tax=Clunio marinus TaxID=568069 RepID=A0A1J1J544_9DIPT|nr:CLUMA_CG019486, isoform A [Clunio marinus]
MEMALKGSKDYQRSENDHNYSLEKYISLGHVHGLKYLGRKGKFERYFWISVLLAMLAFTVYVVFSAITTTPVHLTPRPLNTLPFPAITICPETKAQKKFADFTKAYRIITNDKSNETLSDEEMPRIEALSQICDPHMLEDKKLNEQPTPGKEFLEILREISYPNFILFCKYRGIVQGCNELFKEIVTDDGICYTFNMLDLIKSDNNTKASWSVTNGYENENFVTYPRRAFSGSDNGMNVVIDIPKTETDYLCRGPVQGYKLKIHSADEFPVFGYGYQRIPPQKEVLVSVTPEITSLKENCIDTNEKPLKHFTEYTYKNCMTECLSSFVLSKCGCVKFSMVHENDTEICNQHQTSCVSDAFLSFYTSNKFKNEFFCDCKPSCKSLKFKTSVSQSDYNHNRVFEAYGVDVNEEFPNSQMSRLIVYLEDDFYMTSSNQNYPQETFIDKIAKIGGLLAFFLGASLISFIEIFFYLFKRCFS